MYNHISWRQISELEHKKTLAEEDEVHVYTEEEFKEGGPYNFGDPSTSRYKMQDLPVKLTVEKVSKADESPALKMGVSMMCWSHDSRYLATKNDNTPNAVYIWDMTVLKLHVVLI